jgi:HisJ family histidinol phosphate phosphatase
MITINYDMHIHTEYCGHAPEMTIRALCARADELGLKTVAITDHIFEPEDLYIISRIREELSRTEHNCRVIIGAEVDVDSQYDDGRLVTDETTGIDYLIAGFHYIPTVGNYPFKPEDCTLEPEQFLKHWRKAMLGIVSNPRVSTLAHPARLAASALAIRTYFDKLLEVFEEAAEISARNNIAWEINELTGYRFPSWYLEKWPAIYQIALDAGVKLTYGSDAHAPDTIGLKDFTLHLLDSLPEITLAAPDELIKKNK